jgi:uncharacterized Tic20 family protein
MTPPKLTSEEKFWAVLAHLSALVGGVGLIIPTYGWAENRTKSRYAAFQSLQALGYQTLGYTLWTLAYVLVLIVLFVATLPMLPKNAQDFAALNHWLSLHVLVSLGLYAIYMLFPVIAAVTCALGRDFYYPLLGRRLAHYIRYDPTVPETGLDEEHEERFAVSMGHFGVIFPLTGLLVPVVLLATQAARSRFVKFQAAQTLVFQLVGSVLLFGLGLLAFAILVAGLLPFALALVNSGQPPMEGLFSILVFLTCLFVIVLIVPLFQILGQWAGLRILQGRDYRYPLVGRRVEDWLAHRPDVLAGKREALP